MKIDPDAGKLATARQKVDVARLIEAYYSDSPDISVPEHRVTFGTSGHRGSSLKRSFNEKHIWAISQSICEYRMAHNIQGPLFMGMDTHALSLPAFKSVIEVMAANQVEVFVSEGDEFTPSPVISHAILKHNRDRKDRFADGIVITPSHNPPDEGGIKYDPPNGGGASSATTDWIEKRANQLLENQNGGIKRLIFERAIQASCVHRHNYLHPYIDELSQVIDLSMISESRLSFGVDPLGGAGVHYWGPIAEKYNLNLTIVNDAIDPTFSFMSVDWDGRIRMDPSSPYAMQHLVKLKERFSIIVACDTDHDRHGVIAKSVGLLPANHFLSASLFYLLSHRSLWKSRAGIGKTVVTTQILDRVAKKFHRNLVEFPVGFKWFAQGLFDQSLVFAGEQSAGATFSRMDGSTWTTDKDGIVMALLAAEMTARLEKDPGDLYREMTREFGDPFGGSIEAVASRSQKNLLKSITSSQIRKKEIANELIRSILTRAPGNDAPIGGIKVTIPSGWFVIRPSGTEDIIKIYAESFKSNDHLQLILHEAEALVDEILGKR